MTENSENEKMSANTNISTDRRDPSFWREAWQQARLVFYLLRDPEVPFYLKFVPFVAFLYLLWPFDLLPAIPVDDITFLLVGGKVFIELAPQHVVIKHLNAIREKDGYSPLEEESKDAKPSKEDQQIIEGEIIIK
jgi:uncharacterized membrane protein YkvA (DUF1232 family)